MLYDCGKTQKSWKVARFRATFFAFGNMGEGGGHDERRK
jgi:hypothetical protein